MQPRRLSAAILVLALVVGACGSGTPDDTQATTDAPTPSAAPTTPTPAPTEAATTPTEAATTPSEAATTPAPTTEDPSTPSVPTTPPPSTELPGTPIDFGPRAGDVLAVIGVQYDDRLNLRAAPGTDQEILARLEPTEDDVVALGHARMLPRSLWYEVEAAGAVGWVRAKYVAYLGPVDDVTSGVIDDLGMRPSRGTMAELGLVVARTQASTDPEVESTITMVVAADESGDLGEVTYDVIGLADDAGVGFRVHVFGTPTDSGFTLKSVERTELCGRGISEGGLCT